MTIMLELSPELEKKLKERAAAQGKKIEDFVLSILYQELHEIDRQSTIDAILKPFRAGFQESDLQEEELSRLLDDE